MKRWHIATAIPRLLAWSQRDGTGRTEETLMSTWNERVLPHRHVDSMTPVKICPSFGMAIGDVTGS